MTTKTRLTPTCCQRQQGFRDALQRLTMTLMLVMLTAIPVWAANQPIMNVEVCSGGPGYIHVKGWTYDPDDAEYSIDIRIVVFSKQDNSYLSKYICRANRARTDVSALQSVPGNHGFDNYIPFDSNSYWVNVVASDRNGDDDDTTMGSYSVTVATPLTGTVTLTPETGIIVLGNGATLTGRGGENTQVAIASNATVTLNGVDITAIPNNNSHEWAGITCLGNATIVLAEGTDNTVQGGYDEYPGILASPLGKTLTIRGSGSLTARANGSYGAGIGSGLNWARNILSCGNIVIEDGNITAYGGNAAAIGASSSSCGTITISGGTIYAESDSGPGIGCWMSCSGINITGGTVTAKSRTSCAIGSTSSSGNCSFITISGTQTTVIASTGSSTACTIGSDPGASCGNITIGGVVVDNITINPYAYFGGSTTYTVGFNANDGTGEMTTQEIQVNTSQALTANTFIRPHYVFGGWNTKADGTGTSYADGETVYNLGNLTLYAQWQIETYSITYVDAEDGTDYVTNTNPTTYTYFTDAITLTEPTRLGYTFDGWTYEGQDTPTKSVTIPNNSDGNITLTAHWIPIPIELTSDFGEYTLGNGHVVSGTGGANTHLTIADGATVTLNGVDITAISTENSWAGITCAGNATIILSEGTTNNLKGGFGMYPGIQAGTPGTTLIIRGSGTLYASSSSAAGIGAPYGGNCGNITIEGGTIVATGNFTGAGIGGGNMSSCGDITITNGVTCVTATAGASSPYSIGGPSGKCGKVTIGGVVTGSISQSPFTYNPSDTSGSYTITFDANGGEGSMDDQVIPTNTGQALAPNTFTNTDLVFKEWNTAADGSGTSYRNEQQVINLGNVTLYAQWRPIGLVELSSTSETIRLRDGQTLTGKGGNNTKVSIVNNATVTLLDVNITNATDVPGIRCEGNATIILEGSNKVKGSNGFAGIQVAGSKDKTLTITGSGSLTATGGTKAAGIGTNSRDASIYSINGNILITGGTITAIGGVYAAGIGTGYAPEGNKRLSLGTITIAGGNVTATGGKNAASIGTGFTNNNNRYNQTDGITITGNINSLVAKKAYNTIGGGYQSYSVGVSIAPGLYSWTDDEGARHLVGPSVANFAKEGFATYYNSEVDATLPAGMKARIVTANCNDGTLMYETIADGDLTEATTAAVPASTPVMLQVAPAEAAQAIEMTLSAPEAEAVTQTNYLHGSNVAKTTDGGDAGAKYYKLTYNQSGENIGWYWGAEDGAKFKSAANKAWLALPASAGAQEFFGLPGDDETTEITTLNVEHGTLNDDSWYSLDGRKLNGKPTQKGVYIYKGKKIVIK